MELDYEGAQMDTALLQMRQGRGGEVMGKQYPNKQNTYNGQRRKVGPAFVGPIHRIKLEPGIADGAGAMSPLLWESIIPDSELTSEPD